MNRHVLRPLEHQPALLTKKCVFDVESINWIEPYACGFYDGETMQVFDGEKCIDRFLSEYLTRKYAGYTAYAHNGGKFDFSFVMQSLLQNRYHKLFSIEPLRIGSRIVQITLRSQKMVWTLRDTFAMLPFKLKDLTQKYGVADIKGEFNHEKINWKNWQDLRHEWAPYLTKDCKGLYQVLQKDEQYDIEKFDTNHKKTMTIAQLALRVYRRKYLKMPIHNYRNREEDIRKSYFGGRVEIFKTYGENLNYYDVNSLYPFVMRNMPMPVGIPVKSFTITPNDFGVVKCQITTPTDINIPLLPYKTKSGKLIFPRGTFNGWYTTAELKKAEQLGYKINIDYGYKFDQDHIFKEYIDELYKIKQNAQKDSIDYIKSKLLMNSLYGKFGQRREKEQIIIFPQGSTLGMEPFDAFEELPMYVKKITSESTHILPAIASFVTSYARLYLYEIMEKCKEVYYIDTDSCITSDTLQTGKELGELKLECTIDEGVFLLPKMYGLKTPNGEIIKCKGFPNKMFQYNVFKEAIRTGDYSKISFQKRKMASPFESYRRNKTWLSMIDFSRRVMQQYDKRTITNGVNTDPLTITETA